MRKSIATLVAVTLAMIAAVPADAGGRGERGSFVAHALPFAAMKADIYYPEKGSCLDGVEGIHKVSEPFRAPVPGALSVYIGGLSGDWDLYAGARWGVAGNSEGMRSDPADTSAGAPHGHC